MMNDKIPIFENTLTAVLSTATLASKFEGGAEANLNLVLQTVRDNVPEGVSMLIVVPDLEELLGRGGRSQFSDTAYKALNEMKRYGAKMVVSSQGRMEDLHPDYRDLFQTD